MNYVESIRDIEKIKEMKSLLKKRSERDCFLFTFGINQEKLDSFIDKICL